MRVFFEFEALPTVNGQSRNRVSVQPQSCIPKELIYDFQEEGWLDNPNLLTGAPSTDRSGAFMSDGFVLNLDIQGMPWPRGNKRFSILIEQMPCTDPMFAVSVNNTDYSDWHFAIQANDFAGNIFPRYEYFWQWSAGSPPISTVQNRIIQLDMQSKTFIVR